MLVGEAIMTKEAEALCIITNDQRGLPRASVSHGEPSIASSVLVFGPMEQMDTIFFDHLRERERLAWQESAEQPARLDWLMTAIPQEVQGQPDLQGVLNVHDPGSYELRVMGS